MDYLMLLLRLAHIVAGALWVGFAVFMGLMLIPAFMESGPASGPVMAALQKRGLTTLPMIFAILTLVSGLWMFWKVSGGFDPAFMRSRTGMGLGFGGLMAILAFIVGMSVTRPAMVRSAALMQSLGPETPEAERSRIMAEASQLRARGAAGARIVSIMALVALAAMALARYL